MLLHYALTLCHTHLHAVHAHRRHHPYKAATGPRSLISQTSKMKFVLAAILVACGLLAVSARRLNLVKRQADPCNIAESAVPEECRSLLDYSSLDEALFQTSKFLGQYCNETCGRPLFDFFRACDEATGSQNSTEFDFYCSRNQAGDSCLESVFNNLTFTYACAGEDFGGGQCGEKCRDNLTMAYNRIGCCAFSFFAVSGGESGASAIFSLCTDVPQTLCIGGASGETLSFPTSSVDVDPLCEDLVDDVDSECRRYLSLDPYVIAFASLSTFCDSECGEEIYDFQLQCDERLGTQNATIIDLLCARNGTGSLCGNVLFSLLTDDPFGSCDNFDGLNCPARCRNSLDYLRNQGGCCTDTIFAVESGPLAVNQLYSRCGLEASEICVGAFSDEPILPRPDGDDDCRDLQQSVPDVCLEYTSFGFILVQASRNPEQFYEDFCNGGCSEVIYEYFLECDVFTFSDNAAYVDFLCSKNSEGVPCVGNNLSPLDVEDVCADVSDEQCSSQCGDALQQLDDTWGCCLFTFSALISNATYASDLWSECGVDAPDLCEGGLSDERIDVPGGDDLESAALTTAITSAVLMFAAIFAF